jgi:predicted AlkP superfamily pyrophosphatase or phosphodiesterase
MRGRALLLLLPSLGLGSLVSPPAVSADDEVPALVLLVAVDQLRRDRLDAGMPGGLGRLAREGRVYRDAMLEHAATETCPGHITMLTGRHPGPAGVASNTYVDMETGASTYCVEDPSPGAAVIGGSPEPSKGRSPRKLKVDTLGDWMKAADAKTRVFTVAGKDRAAITLGGPRPDGAFWLRRGKQPGFTTSLYYQETLPQWVVAWNAVGLEARVPAVWTHSSEPSPAAPSRSDDYPGEADGHSRTSPHPLHAGSLSKLAGNVYTSPFVDDLTLSFARALVEAKGLGGRPGTPDLLAVSLSGTDTVGHSYGPDSLESRDALMRLDAALGEFLSFLEERIGAGRVLVVLTADHGVLPLPEWLAETGQLTCPVAGGREWLPPFILRLYWELHWELSPYSFPWPWMDAASQLTVNRSLARDREIPVERVVAVAERWLEQQASVREAWTLDEIQNGRDEWARLYRNSYAAGRSGDLAVQFQPTCLPRLKREGTTHGSPYDYDRAVPLLFWGPGIVQGIVSGRAATVDIAPTLAGLIGLTPPDGLDGRDLRVTSP